MNKKLIPLDKSFQEVFSTHKEDYMHGMVLFEGVLREKYEDATKPVIKRFVTGGAHVAKWHIEREGPYIKCRFKYNKPAKLRNYSEIADDKDLIESILKLLKSGATSTEVSEKYQLVHNAIRSVKQNYGGQI